jgi:biopolymer transport protein ExbD
MEDKRQVKEINASSMADIAFLLLIFFLVATTMNVDTGITRMLPPIPPDEQLSEDLQVKKRDLLPVYINPQDQIMVAGSQMDITQLTETVKRWVLNQSDDENMPSKKNVDIAMPDGSTWTYPQSQGVISLNSATGTTYNMYVMVQNELTRAFNEIRNEVAMSKFGKPFSELDDAQRETIAHPQGSKGAVPMNISESEPKNYGGVQ